MSDEAEDQWFQPSVESGNVAGARIEGDDLLVRFHSGAVYRYPGEAGSMGRLLGSESPGSFVWRHLRGKKSERVGR